MNRSSVAWCFWMGGIFTIFCKASSIGENPNSFIPEAKRLETFSSRYDMPTNDPSLIAKLPFTFGYRFTDDYGTLQTREEKTDPNGSKTGSYSFVDAAGTYRQVDYIADHHGFRATVKTNEPGTLAGEPADVTIQVGNDKPFQRNVRHSPPQLEYSNHVFSRYNYSSNHYGQRIEHPGNAYQGGQNPPYYGYDAFFRKWPQSPKFVPQNNGGFSSDENFYKGAQYPVHDVPSGQQLAPQNNQGYSNGNNYYNGPSSYPANEPPTRQQLLPQNDQGYGNKDSNYNGPQYPIRQPLRNALAPEIDIGSPVGYPKLPGLNPEEFFNDPNLNAGYAFGDKIADSGFDNKPEYSLLPPTPPENPRRQRNYRQRPNKARNQYKIHTPKGYENHQDLPLYMDK